jgi:hypothetical protein
VGESEQYASLSDGISAMEFLAMKLSGREVSERERKRRTRAVEEGRSAEAQAAKDAEKARAWAAARNKFLKNSGIAFGSSLGFGVGGTSMKRVLDESGNTTINGVKYETTLGFFGSGDIELYLCRYLGIQTGINLVTDYAPYTPPGEEEQYAKVSFIQIPILVRLNFSILSFFNFSLNGREGIYIVAFGGLGMNALVTSTSNAASADPGKRSLIFGGEAGLSGQNFGLFAGYRWNGGFDGGSVTANGVSYDYSRGSHTIYLNAKYSLPFRR